MSFINMAALFLLFTVPGLILLYFLKLKRPQIRVPSTLLWQKVIEDMRVNSPFQKLRRSLLLLLQLLALLAVIFALARPMLKVRQKTNESVIVLLDNSASMAALGADGRMRLNAAKALIGKLIDGLGEHDEMMFITFNSRPTVVGAFSSNKRALKEMVERAGTTDCGTDAQPALLLAKSICNSKAHPRVILVSDGVFPDAQMGDAAVEVEYQSVGESRPNLAITGLDVRRSLDDRNRIEMFVAAENFSDEAMAGNMNVRLGGRTLDSKYFTVGPRETLSQIFEADLPEGCDIEVEFDVKDALACDNRAWRVIQPPERQRVLVVGDSNFFLERAFKASPSIQCVAMSAGEYSGIKKGDFSAVIWNAVARPEIAPCDNIYLGCAPELAGLKRGAEIESPDILDWDNAHPLTRFIDFDNLIVSTAAALTLPEYAVVVLRSSRTPLAALLETGEGNMCVVGFDPMKSNWPLLVSFPLFLNNCLEHFEKLGERKFERNIRVGRIIGAPRFEAAPTIESPSGRKETMKENPAGDYSYTDVTRCGIYKVGVPGGQTYSVAANLFDRMESGLDVAKEPVIAGGKVKVVQVSRQANREFWKDLAIAFACLLVVEWVVYHRRIFV